MAGNILATMLLMIQAKSDTSGLNKTDNAIRRTTRTIRNARKEMHALRAVSSNIQRMFLGGVGLWGAFTGAGKMLQFEKDLGAMQTRFFAITKDEKKAGEEFDWIRKKATDLSLDIKSTADSYSIFYSAVQKSMGQDGARQVFDNWTKVGRVLHLSEYQMERVTYALREMASKGAIYSQDLRMQIGTHVPNAMGLAEEAAKEMGITGTNWFESLQEKAKGNAKITAEFVRRFSAQAEKQFASPEALKKSLQQPDALAKSISNIGYNFMVDFSRAGGSYMVVKILTGISKALTSIDYTKLTESLGSIAKTIGNIFQYLPQILTILKLILQSVAIFYGFKVLGSAFKMFRTIFFMIKQGKFLSSMILKLFGSSLSYTLRKALIQTLIKKGAWAGLKTALTALLGVSGPIGWIVGVAMWLPEIISIVKWIANKMGMGNGENKEELKTLLSPQTVSIMKAVAEKVKENPNIANNPELLKKNLLYYKGGEGLVGRTFVDNGKININIEGVIYDQDELAVKAVQEAEKSKQRTQNKFFNKPVESGPRPGTHWG